MIDKQLITEVRMRLDKDVNKEVTDKEIIAALDLHKDNIKDAANHVSCFRLYVPSKTI